MIDSEITFRKLEIFLAYMEKQNITRAAEQLGLSSVSVHRALHSLEENLSDDTWQQAQAKVWLLSDRILHEYDEAQAGFPHWNKRKNDNI